MIRILIFLIFVLLPNFAHAAWTDNLIFHAPFTNPSNPLGITVGSGSFVYTSSSTATFIHPTTGLVTLAPTNFALYSEDLTNTTYWATSSARVLADQATAPDNTSTADEFVQGASGDGSTTHSTTMTIILVSTGATSETFTASVYAKTKTNTWINLEFVGKNGTGNNCYFNTATGEMGTCSANTTASSTLEANGFYRFSVTASIGPTTGVTPKLRVYLASANGTRTFTGDNTSSVYLWGAQINSGSPSTYVRTTSSPVSTARIESGGVLLEGTRKNYLLWSRDFTNAVWTKTNLDTALTATGMDGTLNSASVLTATANDATACQSITLASASTSISIDIKRVSGTGTVSLSADGGSTYGSDLSGSLSSSLWYRGYKEDQVVTNPNFCIKLGTSGDVVQVDYAQSESGAFISSRIPTTITNQTRYINKLSIQSSGNWSDQSGSFFAIADTWDTARGNKFLLDAGGNPTKIPIHIRSAQGNGSAGILGRTTTYEGIECSYSSVNVDPKTSTKMAARWDKPNNTRGTTASGAAFTNCTFTAPLAMSASSTLTIGDAWLQDGTRSMFGHIKEMRVWNTALTEATLSLATEGSTNNIGPAPTVIASTTTVITATTATLNGSTTAAGGYTITSRGFNYGTSASYGATTTDSGSYSTGPFSADLTSLTCGTVYYIRAYATNDTGTGYSSGDTFTTSSCPALPTLDAPTTSSIARTTVTLNGSVASTDGYTVTSRGFNYGTSISYGATTTDSGSYSTGPFSADITGLTCAVTYYIRAYAVTSVGTGYSNGDTFTTSSCPTNDSSNNDQSSTLSTRKTTSIRSRINNLISSGNREAAKKLEMSWAGISNTSNLMSTPNTVVSPNQNNSKPSFSNIDLKINDSHEDIRKLQKYLNENGFFIAKDGPGSTGNETNVFGPLTKSALIKFQQANNIYPSSGYFGPKTRKFIEDKR